MDSNNFKSVGIIGAGPSGLVSGKSALENNLIPTIFEKGSNISGIWSNGKDGKMWDDMKTTISQYSMGFSDFEFSKENIRHVDEEEENYNNNKTNNHNHHYDDEQIFPHYSKVYNYLNNYAKKFNLNKFIKLNSTVVKIERILTTNSQGCTSSSSSSSINGDDINNKNYKWKVIWCNNSNDNDDNKNNYQFEIFDFLIVATGAFSSPKNCSDLLNNELKSFTGKIIYSKDYKNYEPYKDKRIVILGTSTAGCQISSELSKVTKKCIQVGKQNQWVLNKFLPNENGKNVPWDFIFLRRETSYNICKSDDGGGDNDNDTFEKKRNLLNHYCPKQDKSKTPTSKIPICSTRSDVGIVISSCYVDQVENGSITVYSGNNFRILNSDGRTITFSNDIGEIKIEHDIDQIILCNGYQLDFNFLEKEILDDISYCPSNTLQPVLLYKNLFAPSFKNIAFVSFFKNKFFTECELLSRYACMVFSNQLNYPTNLQFKLEFEKLALSKNSNSHFPVTNYIVHCDELASEIGCLPNFLNMKTTNPKLYNILWNGIFCPASYRLHGNSSNPDLANKIINNYNLIFNKLNNN